MIRRNDRELGLKIDIYEYITGDWRIWSRPYVIHVTA